MKRNHRAEATIEPSWWSHDNNELPPSDNTDDLHSTPSETDSEVEPQRLFTHPASLRIIDPDTPPPATPTRQPAAPEPAPTSTAPTLAAPVADPAAVQLATCYAIDHLSWDATNPARREAALARYLPAQTHAGGWSGRGRQRATFAVPGAARHDDSDPTVVWIDVRVLITCYEPDPATNPRPPAIPGGAAPGELTSELSSVPAPDAPGWRALDADWVHLVVPITHDETGRPRVRPDLTPTTHEATDLPGLTVVPAAITEGE